jgi:hypothetical protein
MQQQEIPRDLPQRNPLLFSFLMILEALPTNLRFSGNGRSSDKILPCFEYAVNSWRIVYSRDPGGENNEEKLIEMDVSAAVWKEQPEQPDCGIVWSEFPDGTPLQQREFQMGDFSNFESWRTTTLDELEAIVSALVFTDLHDIFGWQIINDSANYLYARDVTSNKFFGVGVRFTLRGYYFNCCPDINRSQLRLPALKQKGFVFTGI